MKLLRRPCVHRALYVHAVIIESVNMAVLAVVVLTARRGDAAISIIIGREARPLAYEIKLVIL